MRFYTADFHLGMTDILRFECRGIEFGGIFADINAMNSALLGSCLTKASATDTIIHAGDLYSFKQDRGNKGLLEKPNEVIERIPATFINVRGNHDLHNKVKSLCESMRISMGSRFPDVSISHYPSYDRHAKNCFVQGDIHLCGHVHSQWKHCLDLDNSVLNINVGVDVWNY